MSAQAGGEIERVERALVEVRPGPGIEIERRRGWVRVTEPTAPTHFRNGVLRSVLSDEEAPRRVDETIAHFARHGVPLRWFVTPSTRPVDLADLLLARGFERAETLHAMTAQPADFPAPDDRDVEIVEVDDEETREEWLAVCEDAWGLPLPALVRFRRGIEQGLAERPRASRYFVARIDGVAAASASFRRIEDFAHFSGGATRRAFRGRGLYSELVRARMAWLRERGVGLVTNHCVSTTSAPICARLGFRRVADFAVYVRGAAASRAGR